MPAPSISVIICTHNPREDYLKRTLDALRSQTLDKDLWELVLIDNVSRGSLAEKWNLSWHPLGRHMTEKELGLTKARLAGIRESKAEILCFVDDDNLLNPNYLEKGLSISSAWPKLGVWGGQLRAVYDRGFAPSQRARRIWDGRLERDYWANVPIRKCCPAGGGIMLRRPVAEFYRQSLDQDRRRTQLDRKGGVLLSSGDVDMAYCACDMGLGIARLTDLIIDHLIPASRCEDPYLDRLVEGFGYSDTMLAYLRERRVPTLSRIDRLVAIYKRIRSKSRPDRDEIFRRKGRERAVAEYLSTPSGKSELSSHRNFR